MKKRSGKDHQPLGAVIYVRVSTTEQANGPLNLSNQETMCRQYCEHKGYTVSKVFTDRGESARTADRPEFQKMLAHCRDHGSEVGYVVVQDLSRFARNNRDQGQFIAELAEQGVKLCSVYEPNVDNSAAGKMTANMFGTVNQYFSDALSDKMKDRARAAVLAGRFPWPAPIGYVNNSRSKSGPNLLPDRQRAPLVREAFKLMATGNFTKAEVLRTITKAGLRTRKGHALSAQTFEELLKKPIYCGYISASFLDKPVKGLHEPLISEELFRNVQAVLSGRRREVAPKRKLNPVFPLKCFIRCHSCGTPLTGGLVTGKNKDRKFGYYWCRKPGCRAVKIRREKLEATFVAQLRLLKPDENTIADFPGIAEQVWIEMQGNAEARAKEIRSQLEEQKQLKSELLKAKLRQEIKQADYEATNQEFDSEIAGLEEELQATDTGRASLDGFLKFAQIMLLDVSAAWQQANPDEKVGVQNLLFQDGLYYSQESEKFEHPNACLFNSMAEMKVKNWWLASPTGFEPVLPP